MSRISQMSKDEVKNILKKEQGEIDGFVDYFEKYIRETAQQIYWKLFKWDDDNKDEDENWEEFRKERRVIEKYLLEKLLKRMIQEGIHTSTSKATEQTAKETLPKNLKQHHSPLLKQERSPEQEVALQRLYNETKSMYRFESDGHDLSFVLSETSKETLPDDFAEKLNQHHSPLLKQNYSPEEEAEWQRLCGEVKAENKFKGVRHDLSFLFTETSQSD